MRASYHHGDLRVAATEAAFVQVEQAGADAVSLRGVARSVGVSHAAVYRHFDDKQALLGEVARMGFGQLTKTMGDARDRGDDARDSLIATARAYVRFALAHPGLYQVMFGPRYDGGRASPGLVAARRAAYQLVREQLHERDADAADLQTVRFWALLHGFSELVQVDRLGIADAAGADRFVPDLIAPVLDATIS